MADPKGRRSYVIFQVWRRVPMPSDIAANIPQYILENYSDRTLKIPGKNIILFTAVDVNRAHMVQKVYDLYGFGTFDVKHRNWIANKDYSPVHECRLKRCEFYQNKECRIYSKYKPGGGCKDNPREIYNYVVFASFKIVESARNEQGYEFIWDRSKDKMSKQFFWFWKG